MPEVVAVTDGAFAHEDPISAELTGSMGPSAWLRSGGVAVLVVTMREQPFGTAVARTLGIRCETMRYIAVESASHFRSGFKFIAGSIYNVDARAILTHGCKSSPHQCRARSVFPVEIRK